MPRTALIILILLVLNLPASLFAADELAVLESVVTAAERLQPGLNSYHVRVETSRIEDMIAQLTKGMPPEVKPPTAPVIHKFWQRQGKGLVYASGTDLAPYVEKMVQQVSTNLAVELNEMLLPPGRVEQRRELTKAAKITLSDVALADKLLHHLEITFSEPTDLNQAFYLNGMRLPQKQIKTLIFDIDSHSGTVNELDIIVDNGLQLTVEIRYIEVEGGLIPERFKVTSPDGKVDDAFEVKFTKVDGFVLPASMLRSIRRPDLEDTFEVVFKDYQVNQPIPAALQDRLKE